MNTLSTGDMIRGPCKTTGPGLADEARTRHLLALLEGERERDRSLIERLERLVERQGRLIEACRQRVGRAVFDEIKAQVEGA